MADLDSDIDRLYQGPLDGFIDARNALAKATKHAAIKALAKPSLPAWAVNQLYWQHRPLVDRLVAAADTVRAEHQRTLAGEKASIAGAEQAHREVLRDAMAAAKDILTAAGHAITASTLDAVRDTLSALPAPDANGRLVKPLTPRGLEALAGLVLAARPGPIAAPAAMTTPAPARGATAAAAVGDEAERRRKAREAEKAAREREARRKSVEAGLERARQALAAADEAVVQAERDLATRQAARVAAREHLKRAQRLVEELSFGR